MVVGSVIVLRIGSRFGRGQSLRFHTAKAWLARLGAVGFVVALYPNDIGHTIHSVGVGIVIGVVYLFTMIFHFELRLQMPPRRFYADLAIVQGAVFSYAWAFFADSASKQSLQKTCIVGLLLALQRGVTAAEESFQLDEALAISRPLQH